MDINQEDVIVDAKIIESSDVKPSNTKTEKEATPAKSEQSLGEIKDQIKADIKDIAKQLSLAAKYFNFLPWYFWKTRAYPASRREAFRSGAFSDRYPR